jgi:hypothetical protein
VPGCQDPELIRLAGDGTNGVVFSAASITRFSLRFVGYELHGDPISDLGKF